MADHHPRHPAIKLAEASAKAKAEARLGTVVSGRYRLIEVLAMGGVGVVYKGEHVHMHKWVAIKLLHPDAADAPDLVARFRREAVVGAHVQHPNVIAATDFGDLEDGAFFLVLEYVRGVTLREVIQRGPLSVGRAVRIARQIASALAAVHAIGIVHRDLTPRNVMLLEGERDAVKLIDFGLAKLDPERFAAEAQGLGVAENESPRITGTGAVFGTIAYLAPEVALGMDLVDSRADLYALGIVLYEMLSGKHPFDTTDAVQLFKAHASTTPPPIAQRTPGVVVPKAVEAVAMRLLEKAPDLRYETAEELIAALDAALDETPLTSTPPPATVRGNASYAGPSLPPLSASSTPLPSAPSATPLPKVASTPPAAGPSVNTSTSPLTMLTQEPRAPFASVAEPPPERWPYVLGGLVVLAAIGIGTLWYTHFHEGQPAPAASTAPIPSADPAPATPPASAETRPAASISAPDPAARAELRLAMASHDFKRAMAAFSSLVDRDPAAFRDPNIALTVRDLAVAISPAPADDDADKLFGALANRLGADGVDILYEIARTRGGSKAAARAEPLLQKSEVMARGTPALQITWALRVAPCQDKLALLDRAANEGDVRTLREMETAAQSCFPKNQALLDAMKALKQRVNPRP